MKIIDSRIKVSFDRDEEKALNIVRNIILKLRIKDVRSFLDAFVGCDWIYYEDGESEGSEIAIEFLNNSDREEEDEQNEN